MALFNEDNLKKKLNELNLSQQSIQTLSLWLIHHKKHAHTVVNLWVKELCKASDNRKLVFMYLANDVIQNSKKKGPEYFKEFLKRLPKVFEHLGSVPLDEKSKQGLNRLLNVWEERAVFTHSNLHAFKRSFEGLKSISIKPNKREQPPKKKLKRSSTSLPSDDENESGVDTELEEASDSPGAAEQRCAGSLPTRAPIDNDAFLSIVQSLESAATADAKVRKEIAALPAKLSETDIVSKLSDVSEARALDESASQALNLLNDYNGRLNKEMDHRKQLTKMLHDNILYQKEKLAHTEYVLEEYRGKLSKVMKIKAELNAHLQNLPDISRKPNAGSSLAPLPSAGDLFTS